MNYNPVDIHYSKLASKYTKTIDLINNLDLWIFLKNLPQNRTKILDIGCGTGSILKYLGKYFDKAHGIDVSKGMITQARLNNPNGDFISGDANSLPYKNNEFDMVISHAVFHYLNRNTALKEAIRILKPNGKLVIAEVIKLPKYQKYIEKLILRYIFTLLRLIKEHGFFRTIDILNYISSPDWQNLVGRNQNNFSPVEFRRFYSKQLDNLKYGIANYRIRYIVWQKPK